METSKNRHDYAVFHRFLIKSGFIMMQKSVYSKLVINGMVSKAEKERIGHNLPSEGIVEDNRKSVFKDRISCRR